LSWDAGDLGYVDCLCTSFFRLPIMIIYRVSQLIESRYTSTLADVRFVSRCFDKGEKNSIEGICIIYSVKPEEKTVKTTLDGNNIKQDFRESVGWIQVAQNKDQ